MADRLRITLDTLYYVRHQRRAPRGIRVGRRIMVRRSELERWLAEQEEPEREGEA